MSNRVSKAVLLCEDQEHQRLVFAFLKRCGIKNPGRIVRARVASLMRAGGNIGWVLDELPKELRAFRNRQSKANSLLIVVADADDCSVQDRRAQLNERVRQAKLEPLRTGESVALLIPKRNVETWIRYLLAEEVTETDDYKSSKPIGKDEFRKAADRLYDLSRPNAARDPKCPPALGEALPAWCMIGDCLR